MKRLHITLLIFLLLIGSLLHAQPVITFGEDTSEYPLGDFLITAASGNAQVNWYINGSSIDIRMENCNYFSLEDMLFFYRPMLEKYVDEFGKDTLKSVFSSGFFSQKYHAAQAEIALRSSENALYADYRANYPNSKLTSLNNLFVELTNKTKILKPIYNLFADHGMKIELRGVEKVFTGQVSTLTFKNTLIDAGLKENDRVMYDAGSFYFHVSSLE